MANNNHFELNLDTLAPTGSITRVAPFMNTNGNLTIGRDITDAVVMKVWFNDSATGSESDATYPSAWEAFAVTKQTEFSSNGTYYYHLQLMDSVNNKSVIYDTASMIYDTSAPEISNVYLADSTEQGDSTPRTKSTTIKWKFVYTETGGSGVARYLIHATDMATDIDVSAAAASPVSGTLTFDQGVQDGTKTVTVTMWDNAGNVSQSVSATIILDTQLDKPTMVVTKHNDSSVIIPDNGHINYHEIDINLSCDDTGVVGYKVWEDGDTEPAYTEQSEGTLNVDLTMTLSANDGTKIIHAKVKDISGNETAADNFTVVIDTVKPVVSLTTDVNLISNVSGSNTATLTLSATDAAGNIAAWDLTANGTSIKGATTTMPESFSLTSANSLVEGSNTIVLSATDEAGNSNTSTVTITLDTTAPTVTIGTLSGTSNGWYNAEFDIPVTMADDHFSRCYAWVDTTQNNTNYGSTTPITTLPSIKISSSDVNWAALSDNATIYVHIVAFDSVGNMGADHKAFKYDHTAPETPTVNFGQGAYDNVNASITITASDATSGLGEGALMRVTGDITDGTTTDQWEAYASSRNVTLTSGDGMKNVYVTVKDVAGNVSSQSAAAVAELDTVDPSVILTLFEADGTTTKPAFSPVRSFELHVAITDDNIGDVTFKCWGDWNTIDDQSTGIAKADAPVITYNPETGYQYMVVTGYCTNTVDSSTSQALKRIYVEATDSAGNVTETPISFTYDIGAPTVVVSDPDYNIISTIHEYRLANVTATSDYADEVKFTFTPSEDISEYKVCAYKDRADAEAVVNPGSEIPILMTNQSSNMSGTGLILANTSTQCLLKGADYETAIRARYETAPESVDGAHFVVVYVKDKSGQWSEAADFTVVSGN